MLRLGQPVKAKPSLQESIAFLRHHNGKPALADALQNCSMAHYLEGDYKEALVLLDEGRLIAHEQHNDWTTGLILASSGLIKQSLGDYDKARVLMMQGVTIFRDLGDARLTAIAFGYLSLVTYLLGEHIDAKGWAHESLRLSLEMNDRINLIHCLNRLGAMACTSGGPELSEAERFYADALAAAKEMGDQWQIAISLSGLGYVNCARTGYPAARQYFLTALRTTVGAQ
jgi:tetratricopeptide (TPR) repeat protein